MKIEILSEPIIQDFGIKIDSALDKTTEVFYKKMRIGVMHLKSKWKK